MLKRHGILLLFALISALVACQSMTSLQTARTVKQGQGMTYFALGSQGIRFTKQADDELGRQLQRDIEKVRVPVLEGGYRLGVSDRADVGGRVALLPGTLGIDAKYGLSGALGPFATATGLGVDYASF